MVRQEVEKMEEDIKRERRDHEKALREAQARAKEFEGQLNRIRTEALELR